MNIQRSEFILFTPAKSPCKAYKNVPTGNFCIPVKVQMPKKSGAPLGFQSEINQGGVRSVP